jgi:surface protein
MKKLLLLSALLIFACTDDEGNPCVYEPTLTTEAVTDITETSATLNGTIDVYSQNCDTVENILQGFVYSTSSEPTIDDDIVNVDGTSITESLTNLEPNTTYYVRVFLVRPLIGVFYGNEVSFVTEENIEPIDCDVVYLDENGVTIKAYPCANIGDIGIVNGVEYTVVDNAMLSEMGGEFGQTITADFTRLCTTRVTGMAGLFLCVEDFNQPIGNWDVSNVTDMSYMFYGECASHLFNQNISQWNVSNVTNMQAMFFNGYFNQPIGNWNISNVADMTYMFQNAYTFNQDLSSWDMSNVTDCGGFSYNTPQWTLPQPNFTNCNPN